MKVTLILAPKVKQEMSNNNKSNLSEYFANDPPSFFDELTNKPKSKEIPADSSSSGSSASASASSNIMSTTFSGFFQPPEYVETPEVEAADFIKVSDDVRNLWELPPENETGKLIMPGIHLQNDLVAKKRRIFTKMQSFLQFIPHSSLIPLLLRLHSTWENLSWPTARYF